MIRPVWLIPASGGWRTGRAGYWGSGRGPDGCSQSLWWSWSAGAAERTETRARPPETHSRRTAQLKQSVCFCVSAECWFHFHFKDTRFFIFWEQMCSLFKTRGSNVGLSVSRITLPETVSLRCIWWCHIQWDFSVWRTVHGGFSRVRCLLRGLWLNHKKIIL